MLARRLIAVGLAASLTGCLSVLGDFEVEPLPPGVTKCDVDKDCGTGNACYAGTCTKACGTNNPCPAYRKCNGEYCSLPVGTSCKDGANNCGSGICAERDANSIPVDVPYCTYSCAGDNTSCPPGYSCVDSECRK